MSTSREIVATFTAVGLAAVARADAAGLLAQVTQVGIGAGLNGAGYNPNRDHVTLYSEFARRPISQADDIAPNEVMLGAVFETEAPNPAAEGWVREVGFYLADGTLLCVWSELTGGPLAYRTCGTSFLLGLSILIEAIPKSMLNFVIGAPSLTLLNLGPTVVRASADLRVINQLTQSKVDQFTAVIAAS